MTENVQEQAEGTLGNKTPTKVSCARCGAIMEPLKEVQCPSCRAIRSPFKDSPDDWILLPPKWLGIHAIRYEEAATEANKSPIGKSLTLTNFAIAMALLEDWNIKGLGSKPENWDFEQIDLAVIAWITNFTLHWGILKELNVPKNY